MSKTPNDDRAVWAATVPTMTVDQVMAHFNMPRTTVHQRARRWGIFPIKTERPKPVKKRQNRLQRKTRIPRPPTWHTAFLGNATQDELARQFGYHASVIKAWIVASEAEHGGTLRKELAMGYAKTQYAIDGNTLTRTQAALKYHVRMHTIYAWEKELGITHRNVRNKNPSLTERKTIWVPRTSTPQSWFNGLDQWGLTITRELWAQAVRPWRNP